MKIYTYTYGERTIIGCEEHSGIIKKIKLDSIILFENPDLVYHRFLNLLKRFFNVNNEDIELMVFSISGIIIEKKGIVKYSYHLNHSSSYKIYDGFSFKDCFQSICGRDKIYVMNDVISIALGFKELYGINSGIILLLSNGLGVSKLIDGKVIATELGSEEITKNLGELISNLNESSVYKNLNQLIGKDGYTNILKDDHSDFIEKYSLNFFLSLTFLKIKCEKDGLQEFYIWTDNDLLLYKDLFDKEYFTISFNNNELLPMIGCSKYPKYNDDSDYTIKSILYFSNEQQELINNLEDFIDHWKSYKLFADKNSRYSLIFHDKRKVDIKISQIDSEDDIKNLFS